MVIWTTSEHSKRKALPWIKCVNTHWPPHLDTPTHRNPLSETLEKNSLQPYNVILSFLPSILLNIFSNSKNCPLKVSILVILIHLIRYDIQYKCMKNILVYLLFYWKLSTFAFFFFFFGKQPQQSKDWQYDLQRTQKLTTLSRATKIHHLVVNSAFM